MSGISQPLSMSGRSAEKRSASAAGRLVIRGWGQAAT
jgi:hypothetical protein